jgi:dienelactone hydrolase
MSKPVLAWLLPLLLVGCSAIPTPQERISHADGLTAAKGWQASRIPAGRFELVAYLPKAGSQKNGSQVETLTIYIEGDGLAWVNGHTPSVDPTPRDPIALRLALAHPGGPAVFLARPCQYVDAAKTGCAQSYWTEQRFAPEVVESTHLAVEALKQRFGARQLVLVGYSGGAAIAALVTTRRDDVARLVTVAGNLDHEAWTRHHRVTKLSGSLNPAREAARFQAVPQTHFIGSQDKIITPILARQWPTEITGPAGANVVVIDGFDHVCCWSDDWAELFEME